MTRAAVGSTLLLLAASCASVREDAAPTCAGITAPRVMSAPPVSLPATYTTARVGGSVTSDVVVAPDATVREVGLVAATTDLLVAFAENGLRHARFQAGSIENNPAALRFQVTANIGASPPEGRAPMLPSLRAFVSSAEAREARWQLRDSVRRITIAGRAALGRGGEVVAVAPDGRTQRLESLGASLEPRDFRRSVSTGRFFSAPGDYRIELREGERVVATARFTIAEDAEHSIVNACDPPANVTLGGGSTSVR